MIRIFIADDHPVVRHGLRRFIEGAGEMAVVGEASDGRQVLLAAESLDWDILLLDLSLPRVEGTEVLLRLLRLRPASRVLIVSAHTEHHHAGRLLRLGAAGYVSKDWPPEELLAAIRKVHGGGVHVPDALAVQMLDGRGGGGAPHERLTPREHQVFGLLCQGRSVSEIAAELDLDVSTVSNHVRRIREKLGARTTGEIIGYAHRAGLVR